MKKVFALLLAAAMLLSMAACSGDSTQSTAAQTTSAQTTAAASTDSEAYSAEKFFNMALTRSFPGHLSTPKQNGSA